MQIINIAIQFRMAMTTYGNVVQSHGRKVKGQERDSGRRQYDAWLKIKRLEATQFGRNGAAQPVLSQVEISQFGQSSIIHQVGEQSIIANARWVTVLLEQGTA